LYLFFSLSSATSFFLFVHSLIFHGKMRDCRAPPKKKVTITNAAVTVSDITATPIAASYNSTLSGDENTVQSFSTPNPILDAPGQGKVPMPQLTFFPTVPAEPYTGPALDEFTVPGGPVNGFYPKGKIPPQYIGSNKFDPNTQTDASYVRTLPVNMGDENPNYPVSESPRRRTTTATTRTTTTTTATTRTITATEGAATTPTTTTPTTKR